jgi:hypothetical protein
VHQDKVTASWITCPGASSCSPVTLGKDHPCQASVSSPLGNPQDCPPVMAEHATLGTSGYCVPECWQPGSKRTWPDTVLPQAVAMDALSLEQQLPYAFFNQAGSQPPPQPQPPPPPPPASQQQPPPPPPQVSVGLPPGGPLMPSASLTRGPQLPPLAVTVLSPLPQGPPESTGQPPMGLDIASVSPGWGPAGPGWGARAGGARGHGRPQCWTGRRTVSQGQDRHRRCLGAGTQPRWLLKSEAEVGTRAQMGKLRHGLVTGMTSCRTQPWPRCPLLLSPGLLQGGGPGHCCGLGTRHTETGGSS